jgi:RNA polymerase sigma-70 factor, ECF subfamily
VTGHADAIRVAYPRVLAKVSRAIGSVVDAEDAVHDAITRALDAWPRGVRPDEPEAWLLTVALNAHRDRARRARREIDDDALETLARMSPYARIAMADAAFAGGWKDELLGLLFSCCHPALGEGESAALALATVVGLSTGEIARAFVVSPRTMEQRLTRARIRLREHGDPDGVAPERSAERRPAVLRVVHLLFDEGYWSTDDEQPIRADLCRLAIGLGASLRATFPGDPEVAGLLALMRLHEARRAARLDADGSPVPLPQQDRSRWDHRAIADASADLEHTLTLGRPGPYQIEAAISAVHCAASSADTTDWPQIAVLYRALEERRPTPATRVSRAFAEARAHGAERGLALLDEHAERDPYCALVAGVLLAELERYDEAMVRLRAAAETTRNAHERAQIEHRIDAIELRRAGASPS